MKSIGSINEIVAKAKEAKIIVVEVEKSKLDNMTSENHQGVIAIVPPFDYCEIEDILDLAREKKEDPFVMILDGIEDPHNLGAIIRTSEAAGVSGIIIPKDRSVEVNPTVIKTSVGAIDNIPVSQVTNLSRTIEDLKKEGFWIVGTALEDSVDYRDIDYKGKIALVIGNEGKGISRIVRESCDFIAKIPMYGKVNSLNASVASGIMIYEVVRQKR